MADMANAQIRSKQENVARLLEQGAEFDKKKEYAKAAAAYSACTKLDPENLTVHFKHGWSTFKAGSTGDGLKRMNDAIEKGVDDAESLGKLGEILMREGAE